MDKIKLFIKKAVAIVKIIIPFTQITIKNIKQVIANIKEEHYKK